MADSSDLDDRSDSPACSDLPMGRKTQNELLKKKYNNIKKAHDRLIIRNIDLRRQLSEALTKIVSLENSQSAQQPPQPPKQSPAFSTFAPGSEHFKELQPSQKPVQPVKELPRSTAYNPSEKRKSSPTETDNSHTKRANFGAPGGSGWSSFSQPPTKPSDGPARPPKSSPSLKPSTPPFGGWAVGGSGFRAAAPPSSTSSNEWKPNSHQARSAVASLPKIRPSLPTFNVRCATWRTTASTVFRRAKETGVLAEDDFPEPPYEICSSLGCKEKNEGRALQACDHIVANCLRELMKGMTRESRRKFLEEQRKQWHPDMWVKFYGEDLEKGKVLGKKFLEVSRVVGELHESLKGGAPLEFEAKPKPRAL